MFVVHLGYNYYESLLIGYASYCPQRPMWPILYDGEAEPILADP